jgi:nucleotide-binding universal stress UspA family protein
MKPESLHTLEIAMALAKDADASMELVHVPAETVTPEAAERRLQELLSQVAHSEFLNMNELPDRADEPEGERGSVAEAIRNLAIRKRADLVVIGRGAIRKGFGRLYANSYDIIRESPCPVISV